MQKAKLFTIAVIVTILVIAQSAMVSAAPSLDEADSISGSIYSVSVIDDESGQTVVEIVLVDKVTGKQRTVRVTTDIAYELELVDYDDDGNPVPVDPGLWPETLTIPANDLLPVEEEAHHPVGNALAAYFGDLPGVDYNLIMTAHQDGYGFGVIAQALWLTQKMEGDSDVLLAILEAKASGDYSAFALEDGTVPTGWGQFKKAILDGDKKKNLGVVMSGKDKDKDNNGNHGNGSENGNDGQNGNNGNNGNKVKVKDKDKGNNGNNGNKP